MKRKFSFNIAPVKIPLRSDTTAKMTPEPTPSHHSHRRHHSRDSLPSLQPPLINRRPLDPRTEQDLRAACALILQNFKPSDHGMDADPKLDFQAFNRRRDQSRTTTAHAKLHRPTGALPDHKNTQDARKNRNVDTAVMSCPDLPTQANMGRRRGEHAAAAAPVPARADKERGARKNPKSPSNDKPRPMPARAELDSDDGKSVGTPLTASTDAHLHNGSSAPTSAALTSGGNSKRASHQFENAAAVADANATQWMRQELEKKRQQLASLPQPESQAPVRPPSRTRSIRSEIKEYIFPGSTSLSRTQSHESMTSHGSSQQPKRNGSQHGWRSWGLQRKSTSQSSSRPETSKGRIENHEQDRKPSINLNRELPPLPSLDSWKQSDQTRENRKSQSSAHIATVMRAPDLQQQDYAAAVRQHHRRSGSDTLALRYANAHSQSASHKKAQTQLPSPPLRSPMFDTTMDFDQMMSAMSSTRDLDEQLRFRSDSHTHTHTHTHLRDSSNVSRSPSVKLSADIRLDAPPNFSRKISTEIASDHQSHQRSAEFSNFVEIAPAQKDAHKSRLKKVFSGWMLRKEKKDDWMHRFEKEGIKNGVMVQDNGAALPPIVRY